MTRIIAPLLVVWLALLASAVSPAQTGPRLIFVDWASDDDDAPTDLLVVRQDGSGLRHLKRTRAREYLPVPSPDGQLIAVSVRQGFLQTEVYLFARSGTEQRKLVSHRNADAVAEEWSPDGRHVLYSLWLRDADGSPLVDKTELWVVDTRDRARRRLSRRHEQFSAAWSPHGDTIAFVNGRGLHVIGTDGRGLRRLARGATDPQWSPDGKAIAFVREFAGAQSGLYVVDAGGGPPRRLVQIERDGDYADYGFSRDGNAILVGDFRRLALAPAAGGPLRWLTRGKDDRGAVWSPDGTQIAFLRRVEVWVMGANGTGARAVARPRGRHLYRDIAWLP